MAIRRHGHGWQVCGRVRGQYISRWFRPGTDPRTMTQWLEAEKWRVKLGVKAAEASRDGTTLRADVKAYLGQVATMPTYAWRKADLDLWLAVFGPERIRQSITAADIRTQLERWRKDGYSASTCNHRRTALMHLWSVLDGRSAPNPARDVPRYREVHRPPRALTPQTIAALLNAMPDSQTKARLRLMAWTGWPHVQIRRLEPSDIAWHRAVYIRPRQKGAGIEGRWIPLVPQAWQALRAFKKAGAWGAFSTSSMRRTLRLAAGKVAKNRRLPKAVREAVADITPYDFRHSWGTLVALLTRDDTAVQHLMLHSDPRQSQRYTGAAVDPRVLAAVRKVAVELHSGRK